MHRLTGFFLGAALGAVATLGCGGGKKPPADTTSAAKTEPGAADTSADATASGDKPASADKDSNGEKKDECLGFDIANLEDILLKSACEESTVKPDSIAPVDLKAKLQVTVSATPAKVGAGGKSDLFVTFANKSKDPLVLHFKIDPVARFEVEVYDTTKKPKRADMPPGKAPPPPKGATPPPANEAKSARVTLAPNGTARARIPWEAVRMRWAPEKVRGTPPERGYPRAPAGPLPKGKYSVKVVTPLVGILEGGEHEVSAPRVEIEVGG